MEKSSSHGRGEARAVIVCVPPAEKCNARPLTSPLASARQRDKGHGPRCGGVWKDSRNSEELAGASCRGALSCVYTSGCLHSSSARPPSLVVPFLIELMAGLVSSLNPFELLAFPLFHFPIDIDLWFAVMSASSSVDEVDRHVLRKCTNSHEHLIWGNRPPLISSILCFLHAVSA